MWNIKSDVTIESFELRGLNRELKQRTKWTKEFCYVRNYQLANRKPYSPECIYQSSPNPIKTYTLSHTYTHTVCMTQPVE